MGALTELIKMDMKPALGVTEPGAIAFAAATARQYVTGEIEHVRIALNSGMYKNAFTCGIPNCDETGNLYAAALGAVAGDAALGLEALAHIDKADNKQARALVEAGKIEVVLDHMGSEITIDAAVRTACDACVVRIAGGHTDIYEISRNGEILFQEKPHSVEKENKLGIHEFTFHDIICYVSEVEAGEIAFIKDAFSMNMELLEMGLSSKKTRFGPQLLRENGGRLVSEDALRSAQLMCNGAIEARVIGLSRPAMSITGSGAHGIIAVMPLFAWYQVHKDKITEECLLRSASLSYLVTMYIKEYSGKLSAFCGCGIAAGTGMACGLAYLRGAKEDQLGKVIQNMASGLTGMICDGGNQGCVMKGITAVDAAFRAVDLALADIYIEAKHGINGATPEMTMRNMGRIASPGMVETEREIVDIMRKK